MTEISDRTRERVSDLIGEYARLCGRSLTDVAHALCRSKTLAKHGYTHAQKGHFTEEQGKAAIAVLNYWIGEWYARDVRTR